MKENEELKVREKKYIDIINQLKRNLDTEKKSVRELRK